MNILVAFDKFKDSMTAPAACEAASRGIDQALGERAQIRTAPLTDGGEGFCPILTDAAQGRVTQHQVSGPRGETVTAPIGWVDAENLPQAVHQQIPVTSGKIAVIEMASVAGLEQVPRDERHPKNCTTYGVGQLIEIATNEAADAILLGIGGSATSDLGVGALEALGIRFLDTDGQLIQEIKPSNWASMHTIDIELIKNIPPVYIACDVENPLLGEQGAAATYGPQKGLLKEEVQDFDIQSGRVADLICQSFNQPSDLINTPGSGAAGGIGFGLKVVLNAQFVAGFDLVTAWIDLEAKVDWADYVLSGEGMIDQSSLSGKGPISLTQLAKAKGKPSLLLAGALGNDIADRIQKEFPDCQAYSITPPGTPLSQALLDGAKNLESKTADVLQSQLAQ